MAKYRQYLRNQITELLTNYGKIESYGSIGPGGQRRLKRTANTPTTGAR